MRMRFDTKKNVNLQQLQQSTTQLQRVLQQQRPVPQHEVAPAGQHTTDTGDLPVIQQQSRQQQRKQLWRKQFANKQQYATAWWNRKQLQSE